jgi:hypothetical protein
MREQPTKKPGRLTFGGIIKAFCITGITAWLASCAMPDSGIPAAPPQHRSAAPAAPSTAASKEQAPRRAAEERPGLATGFGETIKSPWNRQSFVRASSSPAGTSTVYYNDREGFDAMAGSTRRADAMRKAAGGRVEWGIRSGRRFLPAYETHYWRNGGSRRFVVGREGSHYSIVVKNLCKSRLELVMSVDGLDVIDGKSAGLSKRGYIIAPGDTLEIHGWRTSPESVARFRFSSVAGSYANLRHGDHRNVGVIGLAVFDEKGVDPWKWMPNEVQDRFAAKPF